MKIQNRTKMDLRILVGLKQNVDPTRVSIIEAGKTDDSFPDEDSIVILESGYDD